jgi:fructose-1,6-bisphosphatase/inositol monophosphatase family enzyme
MRDSSMHIDSIADVLDHMDAAGKMALEAQKNMSFAERGYKGDGSVITEADKQVEDYLFEQIARLYPEANILTEETVRSYDPSKPYTFAIDPIDGTDAFSQGMHGWCVSLGLLSELQPVAGVVFAPKLELLFFADVGKRATLNGSELFLSDLSDPLSAKSNIMVASNIHRELDLSKFPGKIRSIGSAALHLCFSVAYPGVFGVVQSHRVHIWDIAGAHAINLSVGFAFEYLDGGQVDYSTMTDGGSVGHPILCGSRGRISELRDAFGVDPQL